MSKKHAPPRDGFGVNKKTHRRGSAWGQYIPASLQGILFSFARCFTQPSFENFITMLSGWILCQGRHCISRVIQVSGGSARGKHFSTLYRFLSRARWTADDVGRVLFDLLLPWLADDDPRVRLYRYEDLTGRDRLTSWASLMADAGIDMSGDALARLLHTYRQENMRPKRPKPNCGNRR